MIRISLDKITLSIIVVYSLFLCSSEPVHSFQADDGKNSYSVNGTQIRSEWFLIETNITLSSAYGRTPIGYIDTLVQNHLQSLDSSRDFSRDFLEAGNVNDVNIPNGQTLALYWNKIDGAQSFRWIAVRRLDNTYYCLRGNHPTRSVYIQKGQSCSSAWSIGSKQIMLDIQRTFDSAGQVEYKFTIVDKS